MYVQQEHRRKGIGKLLLNELIERAKAINEVEILLLDIVEGNFLAKQLYLSLGLWKRTKGTIQNEIRE